MRRSRRCERLQTDRIDLYQFHHIDRHISWQELWQAMEVLVARGEVVYTGSSNFAAWNIAQANEVAAQRHFLGLVSEQSLYNLAQRSIELEVIPAAQHYGLGILPWSPLSGGLLSGGSSEQARSVAASPASPRPAPSSSEQLDAYDRFAAERGWTSASLGLAWLLHQPGVTGPIIGPRTIEQLESAVAAVDIEAERRRPHAPSTSSSPVPVDRPRRPTPGRTCEDENARVGVDPTLTVAERQ